MGSHYDDIVPGHWRCGKRHQSMTPLPGNAYRITDPLWGEFGIWDNDILVNENQRNFEQIHLNWWAHIHLWMNQVEYIDIKMWHLISWCYSNISSHIKNSINMMTSSNEKKIHVTGPLCREFTRHLWIPLTKASQWPVNSPHKGSVTWVARSFDVFFDRGRNKRLSKQWRRWWFETASCSLWRRLMYPCGSNGITPHLPVSSRVLGCEENLYFECWNSRTHPPI